MIFTLCLLIALTLVAGAVFLSREVSGISSLSLAGGLGAISVLLVGIALSTQGIWYGATTYLGDLWTIFEALHKTEQGLESSTDFFSPLGPAFQWILAVVLGIRSPSAYSIVLANVLVASLAICFSLVLLKGRVSDLSCALVVLVAVTTALTARDIDSLVMDKQSSFLAPYNRWGWALLLPVALHAATAGLGASRWYANVLAGGACALLFFLKVTYGVAGLGLYVLAAMLWPAQWRQCLSVVASFFLALVLAEILTGGQIKAYISDLLVAGRMQSNGIRLDKLLMGIPLLGFFVAWSLVMVVTGGLGDTPAVRVLRHWRRLAIVLAIGVAGLLILMQNHYLTEPVLLLCMPLVIAEETGLFARSAMERQPFWKNGAESRCMVLLIVLALPIVDAGFIVFQKAQLVRMAGDSALLGTEMSDLIVDVNRRPDESGQCAESTCLDYRRMLSGRDLLRSACASSDKSPILALNFSNPFPSLSGAPSPSASPYWLHAGRSFSADEHVAADKLFADVGCILEAKGEANSTELMAIYSAQIQREYRVSVENADWVLWVRN